MATINDLVAAEADLKRANAKIERLQAALNEIIHIKDDTLGPRGGITPLVGQEHFDRGCRMAFYRCAEISRAALKSGEFKLPVQLDPKND